MFRDVFSTRLLIVGIVFFLLVAAGTQLYSWHIRRTIDAELARTKQTGHQLEDKIETGTTQDDKIPTETETLDESEKPIIFDDTSTPTSEVTEALSKDKVETLDIEDAFLPEEIEAENSDEGPVSPHGFGPYPEVPSDFFRNPVWTYPDSEFTAGHELIDRVLIKLWKQGIYSSGGGMENGKVYPTLQGTVYVKWKGDFISDYIGHPDDDDEQIISILEAGGTPTGITVLDYDTAGIDPYQFLNL